MVSYLQRDLNSGSKTYYRIGSGNSFYGHAPFFYTREWSASQAYHPKLVVTYTPPSFPDFIVESISLSNTTPVEGEEVTATVVVKNQGDASGNARYLDIWYDKPSAASVGDQGDKWTDVGIIYSGNTKTKTYIFIASGSGTKTFRAFIDSQGETSESNENNNQSTKTYTVVSPSPEIEVRGNNVIITDGDTTPSTTDHTDFGTTSVGSPVSRTYTVKNIGTATLTTSGLSVPSGYTVTEGLSSSIPAGGQDAFTVRLSANAAGTYSGDVSFSNNDSNENPFNFRITGVVGGGGRSARRTISGTCATITVTPSAGTAAWGVEETLPSGLTPSNLTGPNANWNATSRKISWYGTGASPATLGYCVSGADGTYTVSGQANFDGGANVSVTGDNTFSIRPCHPADTNGDWQMTMGEAIAYLAGWQRGEYPMNYAIRAAYLWQKGPQYERRAGDEPMCWEVKAAAPAPFALKALSAPRTGIQAPSGDAASRTITGTTVSITVTPSAGTAAWGFEETIPDGLTPANLSGPNANWNATSRKITWYSTGATAATLGYTVSGTDGTYSLTGLANFDGADSPVSGDTQLVIGMDPDSGSAVRAISGTTVTITVTPAAGTTAWGFEETIPAGLTPANLSGPNANWNATSRKISWYSIGAAAATLGYTVSGAAGTYSLTGRLANFDGADSPVSGDTQLVIGANPSGSAVRTISGTAVTITVTPPAGTAAWGFEETIPDGLTPANLSGPNANWNATSRKITWYNTGAAVVTLGYTVSGAVGTYTLTGLANFDGSDSPVSGDTQLVIGTLPPPVLSVTPATRPVSKGAGSTTFDVANTGSGTMNWNAAVISGGAWARITSGASGSNAGTITIGFDANPAGGAQRTATIRVTAPGATGSPVNVRVVQEANPVDDNGGGTGDVSYLCNPEDDAELTTVGMYDGYLYAYRAFGEVEVPTVQGTLNVRLSNLDGRLTAKAVVQAGNVNFSGKLWTDQDEDGTFYSTLTTRGGERFDLFVRQNRIWGTLTGGKFGGSEVFLEGSRTRFADRKDVMAQAILNRYKGYYTATLCGDCRPESFIQGTLNAAPRGYGYLTLTVNTGGRVRIAGVLADGTSVSQSAQLLYFADCGEWLCVPFFVPLYRKTGYASGLFWIDPETHEIYCGAETDEAVRWEKPGKGPDGFTGLLDMLGGPYNKSPTLQTQYEFMSAVNWDLATYHHVGGAEEYTCPLNWIPVTASGLRMSMPRAGRPVRFRDAGETWYEYGGDNPTGTTLSFTARTGIFRGNFTLYYDYYDARDRFQHKTVRVPYVGVMLQDPETGRLESGYGHCLFPSNDPELKAYRIKPSFPVFLRGQD